jgi:hypothetical protein
VSKTTERTPRAARADAQARPEAPPPTTATVGSAGTGVENTTCSWWKLFLMADCREKPGFPRRPRRRGVPLGGVARPLPEEAAATTTLARGPAGSAAAAGATTRGGQHGGIAGPRSTKCPTANRTVISSVYGGRDSSVDRKVFVLQWIRVCGSYCQWVICFFLLFGFLFPLHCISRKRIKR